MKIYESAENYLETIYMLQKSKGSVRSIDIASELGYSKPSVSVAMKNLRANDFIEVTKDGNIQLLQKGLEIAERMYERHTILCDFLVSLGVGADVAAEDACKMEHVLSHDSFSAIKKYLEDK